jgi:hypothetical protein
MTLIRPGFYVVTDPLVCSIYFWRIDERTVWQIYCQSIAVSWVTTDLVTISHALIRARYVDGIVRTMD